MDYARPMPLEQSTPVSTRSCWQGTRQAFFDLVEALARCMADAAGATMTRLRVDTEEYEGELLSISELRTEITESRWLQAGRITVQLNASDWNDATVSVVLKSFEPVLVVVYHSGTPQTRETLRSVVERALPPNRPDSRRHTGAGSAHYWAARGRGRSY
jgi:hypothetical protein